MKNFETLGIFGHLEIVEVCNITKLETVVYSEGNKIAKTGFQSILEAVTNRNQYPFGFGGIFLGDDIGNGTVEVPEPPTEDIVASDQSVTYPVLSEDTFIDYPAFNKLRFTAIIDGSELQRVSTDARLMFTSASIRNSRGEIVAYKRFPGRSVSPLITLNIRWTLTIEEQCDDIPSRYVTDVLFYVSRERIGTSGDPTAPPELETGEGSFVDDWTMGDTDTTAFVIPLIKWNDGSLEAIEYTGDEPTTEGTSMSYDRDELDVTAVGSYVLEVTANPPSQNAFIRVCADEICNSLEIIKSWEFPAAWDRMTPVGYHEKEMWEKAKFWKLDNIQGSLYGPDSPSGIYNPLSPSEWNYTISGRSVIATNDLGESVIREIGTDVEHITMSFDQNMYPVFAWVKNNTLNVNWFNATTSQNETIIVGYGMSAYVINPSMNGMLSDSPTSLYLVYVRDNTLLMKAQSDRWTTEVVIEENVTDILATGITEMNSMRIVYTKMSGSTPVIHNIGSDRLGAFFHDVSKGGKISGLISEISITDSRFERDIYEKTIQTSVIPVPIVPTTIQYIEKELPPIIEKSIIVGNILLEQKAVAKDSITRLNDTITDFELSAGDLAFDMFTSVINHFADDTITDYDLSAEVLLIETTSPSSHQSNLPREYVTPERLDLDIRFQLDSWTPMHIIGERVISWTDDIEKEVIEVTPSEFNVVEYVGQYHRTLDLNLGGISSGVSVSEPTWWTFLSIDVTNYEMKIGGLVVKYYNGTLRISDSQTGTPLITSMISGNIMLYIEKTPTTIVWSVNGGAIGEWTILDPDGHDINGWVIN